MSDSERERPPEDGGNRNSLEYARPGRRVRSTISLATAGLIAGLILLVFSWRLFLTPHLGSRQVDNRVKSAMNLNEIGKGMLAWARDHNHQLPDSMSTILENEDILPDQFVNPAGSDDRARGPTTQALLADFTMPGHCSYLYFGAGLPDTGDPRTIVACEAPGTQNWSGMNVLFLNGHVEFFELPLAQQLRDALRYGPVVTDGAGVLKRPMTQPAGP